MKQEHEMTPGVLVSGEVLSAGDARARVAVLEAENAELRKRVCVPEGWRVVPVEATMAILDAIDLLCDDHTAFDDSDAFWRFLLAAAPAPVERNQCDGCQAGIPVESGMHRMGKPGGYADLMACTADRYGSAPIERVEQEDVQFTVIVCDGKEQNAFEEWAKGRRMDMDVHPLHWLFLNAKTNAARSGWVGAIEYCQSVFAAAPQPAPTAAQDVAGLVEAGIELDNQLRQWLASESDEESLAARQAWADALAAYQKREGGK